MQVKITSKMFDPFVLHAVLPYGLDKQCDLHNMNTGNCLQIYHSLGVSAKLIPNLACEHDIVPGKSVSHIQNLFPED